MGFPVLSGALGRLWSLRWALQEAQDAELECRAAHRRGMGQADEWH